MSPVFFRNQPLGCTATIIYQMYRENQKEIDPAVAGLLCSAIISDTLLFRSPTCTPVDQAAAMELAKIAGLDVEEYAKKMFSAGSNLKGKTDAEIFYQDFKRFSADKISFGVGQITSLNTDELAELKTRMVPYMRQVLGEQHMDMLYFMLTNILTQSTELICVGQGSTATALSAFHLDGEGQANRVDETVSLPGVVSRKKQLIPAIVMAMQR